MPAMGICVLQLVLDLLQGPVDLQAGVCCSCPGNPSNSSTHAVCCHGAMLKECEVRTLTTTRVFKSRVGQQPRGSAAVLNPYTPSAVCLHTQLASAGWHCGAILSCTH